MNDTILEARSINKRFRGPAGLHVLKNISFTLPRGEFVSITGRSGCGKSTLLYILSTMDTDYEGELFIDNEPMRNKTEPELAQIRNQKIGFVFQFHYLLNEFSVLKNVMLPALKLNRFSKQEIEFQAMEKLRTLGIAHIALKKANLISGGEKQRVAIARALINDPCIIMGDEPTGNLDKKNGEIVFEIFKSLAITKGLTLLIVTHDQDFAKRTNKTIMIDDAMIAF
ncbi:ABC transporter ATP-binding protein [Flavitalea antarctica]